ncbi:hypothetical protein FOC4_g10007959 [Fusarium odoratissimum]|uniref:Uncharacterized protein n=1 Tax=Fusarium oxysporum f. sp. cubense (strain race 4) TaxID=2502994 RepID=N1RP35_FUSC4|nr:hypothetical protein FOC4_g10007959 [Fusarium odoratissimum]
METPPTPTTRESSSSPDLDVTPPPYQLSSPFTRPSTISTGSELKNKSHMPFSQAAGESPSLHRDRGPLPQANLNAVIEETPAYRAPQFRIGPISMYMRNHEPCNFTPQKPMPFNSNVAGLATPANPIRIRPALVNSASCPSVRSRVVESIPLVEEEAMDRGISNSTSQVNFEDIIRR